MSETVTTRADSELDRMIEKRRDERADQERREMWEESERRYYASQEAAQRADDGTEPQDDLNGKADYRRHLARVLTARAVSKAAGI